MSTKPISELSDIINFFGIEESNLLGNIVNLGEDFFLIHNLDILYQSCTKLKPIDKPDLKVPLFLYLIVHAELYNTVAAHLRIHKSIALKCMRSALDCAFTSYYLIKEPAKINVYLNKLSEGEDKEMEKEWNKTFSNIKRTIKNNIKDFPLAKGLPEIHEFCSIYSHSDALGILHRYHEDKETSMLQAKYFDYEERHDGYHRWLGRVLETYFQLFLIYWQEVFVHIAGNRVREIESRIQEFQKKLRTFTEKHSDKAETEDGNKDSA